MSCCSSLSACAGVEQHFGQEVAARDLARYRTKGPDSLSGLLLAALTARVRRGDSVLDVGAGVGILDFELLATGVTACTLVDASVAYIEAARDEAERQRVTDRLNFVIGDFTSIARDLPEADVVAMHRAVCCYPDYVGLLVAAADHSRRLFTFSYPRDRWYVRLGLAIENLLRRLRGDRFRTFVHEPGAMGAVVKQAGFERIDRRMTFAWCIDVFARSTAP